MSQGFSIPRVKCRHVGWLRVELTLFYLFLFLLLTFYFVTGIPKHLFISTNILSQIVHTIHPIHSVRFFSKVFSSVQGCSRLRVFTKSHKATHKPALLGCRQKALKLPGSSLRWKHTSLLIFVDTFVHHLWMTSAWHPSDGKLYSRLADMLGVWQ